MRLPALALAALAACATAPARRTPDMSTPPTDAARALTGTPEAFRAGCAADMETARREAERLAAMPAPRGRGAALEAFDAAMGALAEAGARASLGRNVHPDKAFREVAEACEREVEALAARLSLDRRLYDALAGLDLAGADAQTRWLAEKALRDFRRAGVDRDEATRARVLALREELVKAGQAFIRNITEDVRRIELPAAALDGLPDDYRKARPPGPGGKVAITTNNTDFLPFMTYARDGAARERLWRLYLLRASPQNAAVLDEMLRKRAELARLLGYPSWAAYVTEDKMIGSDVAAAAFVEKVAQASAQRLARDYEELLARKRKDDPAAGRVDAWDSAHYQERVKAETYGFDSREARPYLEYGRVRDGVLEVTARLFGISYRRVEGAPTWHPDVEAFDVLEGGRKLGRIYLDMHPRDGKYKHYAQFTVSSGVAGKRLPEGALVCNFPRPGAEPALLDHADVKALFHEFGHLVHHLLAGRTRYALHSGVSTEWDFVEAPSQMLEEWIWDPAVLATFARHHRTGEPIPADLVRRMRRADDYGKGLFVRQQMFYAALSLELHRRDPAALDVPRLVAELQERYTPFAFVPGTARHLSFNHLEGYSAIYYTYMWSLVIAKDLFTVFQREGLMSPAALRYRRAVLEPGGSKPAAELVKDFLGRPAGFEAYASWLDAG